MQLLPARTARRGLEEASSTGAAAGVESDMEKHGKEKKEGSR